MNVQTKTKQSIPLTVLLVLLTLAQVWGVVSGFIVWQSIVEHGKPHPELPLIGVLLGIVGLLAFVGVWLWRRLAVYLLAVVIVIGLVSDAWFGVPAYAVLIRVVLVGALAWFIRAQWPSFR